MTTNRSSTVASSAATVAPLPPEEASNLAHDLDRWLRPNAEITTKDDLPLLLGEGSDAYRVVAIVGRKPVSHAALYRHTYRLPDSTELSVGVIGAVATDPSQRRSGHAGRCVRHLQDAARRERMDAVVLWDESNGWYERFGFVRSGREMLHLAPSWPFEHLVRPGWVRPLEPRDLGAVRALHERESAATVRTSETWRRLLAVPKTAAYVLEFQGEIEAYGVVGKGNDLQGCLHEWAGLEYSLPALLSGIFAERRDLRELTVMSPPWKTEAGRAMAFHGVESTPGVLGMIWLPDCNQLATKLDRLEMVDLGHDEIVHRLFAGPDAIPFYLRGLDSM